MNTGGPAFPVVASTGDPRDGVSVQEGLTLRDYFAAKAMAALLSTQGAIKAIKETGDEHVASPEKVLAVISYNFADAMLAEREKGTK